MNSAQQINRIFEAWLVQAENAAALIKTEGAWDWWMRELEKRLSMVEVAAEYDCVRLGLRGAGYYDD